jgi:hypothetical protein
LPHKRNPPGEHIAGAPHPIGEHSGSSGALSALPEVRGTEKLRQEADKRVGRNSKELADLLTKKALKGDLAYTKALVGFAEGKKPEPVKKRRGPSQAERLEREPQWKGPPEDDEETGAPAYERSAGTTSS